MLTLPIVPDFLRLTTSSTTL